MHLRLLHIAPLVVRILLTISFCLAFTLGATLRTWAQDKPSENTPGETKPEVQQPPADVQELANRLASNISRLNRKKVLVLDFKGPDKLWLPFSAWLADQFCAALGHAGEPLEIIPRSKLTAAIAERHLAPQDTFDSKIAESLAKSLEAEVIVTGSFVAIENGLGIGLAYRGNSGDSWPAQPWSDYVRGKLSLSSEIVAQLGVPLDSLRPKDGVFRGGEGGVAVPSCAYCPRPEFPEKAIAKKWQGTVEMDVVISSKGRATQIRITKPAGHGYDEQAVRTVQNWKFKPALDPDGKAVPVHQTIEITFHLY